MSARIEATLAVLDRVRNGYQKRIGPVRLRRLRIESVNAVARQRGTDRTTVSNKYRREMEPDFKNTGDFDNAVRAWLAAGSRELERVLRKHAVSDHDLARIEAFFSDR